MKRFRIRSLLRRVKFALLAVVEQGWVIGFAAARQTIQPIVKRWSSSGRQRVLVIAPHPDDEMAGCAGTLMLHQRCGDSVCVAHVTDGRQSRALGLGPEAMAQRRAQEARAAAEVLGVERPELFGLPEGAWSVQQLLPRLRVLIQEFEPDIIYAPSRIDFHPEHLRVAHALALALSDWPQHPVVRVYQVQVPLTSVLTNLVADTTSVRAEIVAALDAYASQEYSLARTLRQRHYAAAFYRLPELAEEFWELPAARYCQLHSAAPDASSDTFRSLRYYPFSDPLAYRRGRMERRQLCRRQKIDTSHETRDARQKTGDTRPTTNHRPLTTRPLTTDDHSSRRLRIALVVPGGVDRSGRERVIPALLQLIEQLARRHEVLVIALDQEPEPCAYELLGAQVVNLGRVTKDERRNMKETSLPAFVFRVSSFIPGFALLYRAKQLTAALHTHSGRFDVLHAFWAGETSTLALLAGRMLRSPVVVSIGGGELVWLPQISYGGQGRLRDRLHVTLAVRLADAVTAGSRYALAPLRARRPDAYLVPLGIDAALYASSPARPDSPPWRLLHVASINRVKDQATLLRALRLVADRFPDQVILDWFGLDTLHGAMEALCRQLHLDNVVRFHGVQPSETLVPFFRAAHLHLISSLHESQCVAVCEAAAAGMPTVGTAVGLLPELAPAAAISVSPGDAEALARGIITLLENGRQRMALGYTAQCWARVHDAAWTARAFEVLYKQIIEL